MARSLTLFPALLLLCGLARAAPGPDATPTAPAPSSCARSGPCGSLPGVVAHEEGPDQETRGPGPQPLQTDGGDDGPPPYIPVATPPPDQDERLASQGYRQETYYTCNTVAGSAHCGWHVPLVKEPKAADGGAVLRLGTGAVAAAVACLAGVFALGMM
ncbi:Uncharacterized protein TPAR_07986 [Tolypocladium paradoxum]|uniref:Uncharacterized protein n=1 Tax=Tolypocladium paradoxum TaxID=94208 RepID=A0A2S4KNR7_9HYPO|nr:Uncharacterized protein TPAR_07986 [Tolypocladium paradoxum]